MPADEMSGKKVRVVRKMGSAVNSAVAGRFGRRLLVFLVACLCLTSTAQGAVAFLGTFTGSDENGPVQVTVTSSVGDTLIAAVSIKDGSEFTVSPPPGWTELNEGENNNQVTLGVYSRTIGPGETNATYSWDNSANDEMSVVLTRYSGVDSIVTSTQALTGSSSNPNTPSVDTTVANAYVLRILAMERDRNCSAPTGHTAPNVGVSAGGDAYTRVAGILQASPGTSGSATFSCTRSSNYRSYTVALQPAASTTDWGDAPDTYLTNSGSGGPNHTAGATLYLGAGAPDVESGAAVSSAGATTDDATGTDDEDAATFSALTVGWAGQNYTANVSATNTTGSPATLRGWIDFDRNGAFDSNETASTTVANGFSGTAQLVFTVPGDIAAGASFARLRISTSAIAAADVGGSRPNGEVEDHPLTIGAAVNSISGTVFRDFNDDGAHDTSADPAHGGIRNGVEPGVAGITVTAYNASGSAVASAVTDAAGNYTLTGVTDGVPYRLEFTGLPDHMQPGAVGVDSSTNVVFAAGAESTVDFGIFNPRDYCDSSPELCSTIFPPSFNPPAGSSNAVIRYNYTDDDETGSATITQEASAAEVGPVYGLAYQRGSGSIFGSAYMRRGAAFGPGGIGAIYRMPVGGTPSEFIDLTDAQYVSAGINIGANPHTGAGAEGWDVDSGAYSQVGKVGYGDIDISDDELTLYAMNLNQREVLVMPLTSAQSPVAPSAAQITRVAVPVPATCNSGSAATGPTAADVRPFALEFHDGKLYVGLVCSAQSYLAATGGSGLSFGSTAFTNARNAVRAHVYELDPATNSFNPTPLLSVNMNYPRQFINGNYDSTANDGEWYPWNDYWLPSFRPEADVNQIQGNFQPMFTDIVFDPQGLMMLGFRDRYADMAYDAGDPGPVNGTLRSNRMGGDLLMACNVSGTWTLESAGVCDTRDSENSIAEGGPGPETNAGPGGSEFFFDERYNFRSRYDAPPGPDYHHETGRGSLALLPGSDEVVYTLFDAIDTFENGAAVFDSADGGGDRERQVQFFGPNQFFAKGGGVGDIELLCDAAPIEIGNRVWNDADGDGIQDPGEAGIANITVELWFDSDGDGDFSDEGAAISSVVTDVNGQYLFSSDTARVDAGGVDYGIANLLPGRLYQVRMHLADADLPGGTEATRRNYLSFSGNSGVRDSDGDSGLLVANYSTVQFLTGGAGNNRHQYDFGVTLPSGLGNFVWFDTDADGVQDVGETGVPGVEVTLYDVGPDGLKGTGDDIVVATENTSDGSVDVDGDGGADPIGAYFFEDIPPGRYHVGFGGLPAGYAFSAQDAATGTEATDSDADVVSGLTDVVTLAAGVTNNDVDAGINNTTASLGDYVWHDIDNDGFQDANEPGIAGVTLLLYQDNNGNGVFDSGSDTLVDTTDTDASGRYLFTGLAPNEGGAAYFVVVDDADLNTGTRASANGGDGKAATVLDGYDDSPNHVDNANVENNTNATGATFLAAGEVNLLSDFGYDADTVVLYSITDKVWSDPDEDGDSDNGGPGFEPGTDTAIAGVTVLLLRDPDGTPGNGDEVVIAETATDGNGDFTFTGLPNGNYVLAIEDENGLLNGYDGTDTHAVAGYRAVTISGGNVTNQSFPYHAEYGTIGDTVWLDNGAGGGTAGNGEQDGG